jgi:Cof subfamily protein (haloacid dehalogenase superfamily)
MSSGRSPATIISAVVSDVDGTLVTDDKSLTRRTQAAVARLRAEGIGFTIISSRPPRGLRMLIDPLEITSPVAGFNGGMVTTPGLSIISQHLLPPAIARQAVDIIEGHGAQAWIFRGQDWLLRDPAGPYVGREQHTIGYPPIIVEDFARALDAAAKIVGISEDFDLLARLEQRARAALAEQATIARSQPYYLDFTHPLANKGVALAELAQLLGIPQTQIAVIGDGANDIAMFERGGLSIAMGNAGPLVQRAADYVTDPNSRDGFAKAIERYVLSGHRMNAPQSKAAASSRMRRARRDKGAAP